MFRIPYENNLSSFNLGNERISHFIIFFMCHVTFAYDVLVGIFAMSMVFFPNFCLDHTFEFST